MQHKFSLAWVPEVLKVERPVTGDDARNWGEPQAVPRAYIYMSRIAALGVVFYLTISPADSKSGSVILSSHS